MRFYKIKYFKGLYCILALYNQSAEGTEGTIACTCSCATTHGIVLLYIVGLKSGKNLV